MHKKKRKLINRRDHFPTAQQQYHILYILYRSHIMHTYIYICVCNVCMLCLCLPFGVFICFLVIRFGVLVLLIFSHCDFSCALHVNKLVDSAYMYTKPLRRKLISTPRTTMLSILLHNGNFSTNVNEMTKFLSHCFCMCSLQSHTYTLYTLPFVCRGFDGTYEWINTLSIRI